MDPNQTDQTSKCRLGEMPFKDVPLGAEFEYQGKLFTKEALGTANAHAPNWGHVFYPTVPVNVIKLSEHPVEPWRRGMGGSWPGKKQ